MEEQERQQAEGQAEPELLYHYTTQEGLLGIIESKMFWATDVRFLNDKREFEDGLQTAIGMAAQASAIDGENGRKIVSYLENVIRFSFSERPIYSISFAGPLKKDEKLFSSIDDPGDRLNMWRSYAGRGVAYSLGLPKEGWTSYIEGLDLQECSYLRETKEEYLTEVLNSFIDSRNTYIKERIDRVTSDASIEQPTDEMNRALDHILDQILPDLKARVAACKHESFWEEREWRLTVAPEPTDDRRLYTSGRFGITPRFRISPRDSNELLPIKRIVIGPCPHMAEAIESLKGLLIRNGYSNMEILPSQIPYRNW